MTGDVAEKYLKHRERIEADLRAHVDEADEAVFQHLVEVATIKRLKDLGYLGGGS